MNYWLSNTNALWMDKNSELRKTLSIIATSDLYFIFMMTTLLYSCVTLTLATPSVSRTSTLGNFLFYSDLVVNILFTIEVFLRVCMKSLWGCKGAYLRNGWDLMDLIIVVFTYVDLFATNLKFVRGIRPLRPVRILSRFPSTMLIVTAMLRSFYSCLNVFLFMLMVMFIYAIIGVQLFSVRKGIVFHSFLFF